MYFIVYIRKLYHKDCLYTSKTLVTYNLTYLCSISRYDQSTCILLITNTKSCQDAILRFIASGCNTVSKEGYRLHEFPCDYGCCAKWKHTVKLQDVRWKGPIAGSVLCSKHFKPNCFKTEGVQYCDTDGIPAKKQLKPNAIPTIFPKPNGGSSQPTTGLQRPALEGRKQKA